MYHNVCSAVVPGGNAVTALTGLLPPDESPTFVETWKEIEKLLDLGTSVRPPAPGHPHPWRTGKVKSIGVSNFSIQNLSMLLAHCTVVPAVNQVEMHPCLPQHALKAFCDAQGILLTAYAPVGESRPSLSRRVG